MKVHFLSESAAPEQKTAVVTARLTPSEHKRMMTLLPQLAPNASTLLGQALTAYLDEVERTLDLQSKSPA